MDIIETRLTHRVSGYVQEKNVVQWLEERRVNKLSLKFASSNASSCHAHKVLLCIRPHNGAVTIRLGIHLDICYSNVDASFWLFLGTFRTQVTLSSKICLALNAKSSPESTTGGIFHGIKFESILFIYGELNPKQYFKEML